jgi:hypothetical protein
MRERVHRLARHQHVQPHHGRNAVAGEVVIERGVAARTRFQAVVEIEHDFVERHLVSEHHAAAADVFELLLRAALLFEQLEDAAQVFFARDHHGVDDGLFDLFDLGGVGELGGVIDLEHFAGRGGDAIAHARRGGDQVDIELALQALLHDFQVQQAEESAAEAEAEGHGISGSKLKALSLRRSFSSASRSRPCSCDSTG